MKPKQQRISFGDLSREPFRLFFPGAVLAGLWGVALWPLHFGGMVDFYPGSSHARLMAHGFFGGFIFGFLATALPRMLSARPLRLGEMAALFALYAVMVSAHGFGLTMVGDSAFLILLVAFAATMSLRWFTRGDLPPPGFVLALLAFACALAGVVLFLLETRLEDSTFWIGLRPLLLYQGFVLLPVLGVGPFILPRFFGQSSQHSFPESVVPPAGWWKRAATAALVGTLIIASFIVEAVDWPRTGHALRLITILVYLRQEISLFRLKSHGQPLATPLNAAFFLLLGGILAITLFPGYRAALLHLTFVGGLAIVTLTVATRVVFGHSGNRVRLAQRHRWLTTAIILMLVGMATRISGDFWPKILVSHYNYGALFWASGLLLWSVNVLPKILSPDPEQ